MKKFLVIIFLIIPFFFVEGIDESLHAMEIENVITASDMSDQGHYLDDDNSYCFPVAELGGISQAQHQSVNLSRIKRVISIETSSFLRIFLKELSWRDNTLVQHFSRIFNTSIDFYCQPPSKYYIFTLKHIII